jgi:hypothetical protein
MACWTVFFLRRPTTSLDTPVYAFITNNEFSHLGNICLLLSAFLMNRTGPAAMVPLGAYLKCGHSPVHEPHRYR